jgi:hypothetical protein
MSELITGGMAEMKDKHFQKLLESVKQAGEIANRRRKPSSVAKFTSLRTRCRTRVVCDVDPLDHEVNDNDRNA